MFGCIAAFQSSLHTPWLQLHGPQQHACLHKFVCSQVRLFGVQWLWLACERCGALATAGIVCVIVAIWHVSVQHVSVQACSYRALEGVVQPLTTWIITSTLDADSIGLGSCAVCSVCGAAHGGLLGAAWRLAASLAARCSLWVAFYRISRSRLILAQPNAPQKLVFFEGHACCAEGGQSRMQNLQTSSDVACSAGTAADCTR